MKKTIKLLMAIPVMLFASTAMAGTITIDESDCGPGDFTADGGNVTYRTVDSTDYKCWWENTDPSGNPSAGDIKDLINANGGSVGDLYNLYKADEDDPNAPDESFSFADNYSTTFSNSPDDPEDATISWDGGSYIDCSDGCYLVVKDGNADPQYWVFDISYWNGMDTLQLNNFWTGSGAISHVEILGGRMQVPEPMALLLLGAGLVGFGIRRRLVKA